MKTITLNENASAKDLVEESRDEEVVILRDSHAVAMLVPFDDDDMQWYIRERDPAFIESIRRAGAQIAAGDTISMKDLKRELGDE